MRAVTSNTEPTLDFVPDMAGVGEPKWTHEEYQTPGGSEREAAKAESTGTRKPKDKAAGKIGRAKLQVRRLTAGRALAAVHWTEEEKKQIGEVRGKRNEGREKVRLMHNRSADEKGHHRIKRYENDGRIWCENCCKSAEVKRITQWPTTKCRGERGEEDQREENGEGE